MEEDKFIERTLAIMDRCSIFNPASIKWCAQFENIIERLRNKTRQRKLSVDFILDFVCRQRGFDKNIVVTSTRKREITTTR